MANEIAKAVQIVSVKSVGRTARYADTTHKAGTKGFATFAFHCGTFHATTGVSSIGSIDWDTSTQAAIIGVCSLNHTADPLNVGAGGRIVIDSIQVTSNTVWATSATFSIAVARNGAAYASGGEILTGSTGTFLFSPNGGVTSTTYAISVVSGTIDGSVAGAIQPTTTNAYIDKQIFMSEGDLLLLKVGASIACKGTAGRLYIQVNYTKLSDGGRLIGVGTIL